ncbi:hypothetical protein GN956_G6231 [Arapaima gigas]
MFSKAQTPERLTKNLKEPSKVISVLTGFAAKCSIHLVSVVSHVCFRVAGWIVTFMETTEMARPALSTLQAHCGVALHCSSE